MHFTPRALIICLALALFIFQIGCPPVTWADLHKSKIEPQIMGTPEEDIAPATAAKGKKSKKMVWIGVIAGVVVLGGLAALAGGGGSGGDSEPTSTGSISIGW